MSILLSISLNKVRQYGKLALLLAISLVLLNAPHLYSVQAQTGLLVDGTVLSGKISDEAKIMIYSYAATPGDLVIAQVMGIKPDMNPTISLLSPAQQQLVVVDNDPFSVNNTNDARLSYILKEKGIYSFLVGGTNGEFILRFNVQKPTAGRALKVNTPTELTLQPASVTSLTFTPDPANPLNLSMISATAGFTFSARIFDTSGQLVSLTGNTSLQGASFIIGPQTVADGTGSYQVIIAPLPPSTQGKVSILLATVAQQAATKPTTQPSQTVNPSRTPVPPTLTPTVTLTPTKQPSPTITSTPSTTPTIENPNAPKGICSATPNTNKPVNVRSGPGTNYAIVDTLLPGQFLAVMGRSVDSAWYINLKDNTQLWVAAQVVNLYGPCDKLDIVAAPPPPTKTLTASPVGNGTPSPTATTKILVLPKTTSTPTLSVTATRTKTPSP